MVSACPPDELQHTYLSEGNYTLTLTAHSAEGCVDTAQKIIGIIFADPVLFPDAFTPNDDGINDWFLPITNQEILNYRLVVFNRWGQQVFTSNDPKVGWDGNYLEKAAEMGTYTWRSTCTTSEELNSISLKGWLILIR